MSDLAKEITPVNIEDELRGSYLDYAMSVIVGRALFLMCVMALNQYTVVFYLR